MKRFILIILASLTLIGCSNEDVLISQEKVFSYKGTLEDKNEYLNTLKSVCGNAMLTIDGNYSSIIREYISTFNCESGFKFEDTGNAFVHDSFYRLEENVEFFIDINYDDLSYEVYSYDNNFAEYIRESKSLDENMRILNRIIYRSFNLDFIDKYNKMLKKELQEIKNAEKLKKIKDNQK